MKKTMKLCSVFMAMLLVVFSCVAPANAVSAWDVLWADEEEAARGIIMQPGSDETQRNFSWYADADVTACSVLVGTDALLTDAKAFDGELIASYQGDQVAKVTVSGLSCGETYYYACVSGDETSAVYSFETVEDDAFSALYISDIHVSGDSRDGVKDTAFAFADLLAQASTKADLNLILSAGDQASDGLRCEYEGLTFSPLSRSLSFATSIGNHDRKGVDYRFFGNRPNETRGTVSSYQGGDYWFVKGDVLFLCIDSNNASGTDHYNFIENATDANADVKWRVVMMHHDLYGGTIESREDENNLLRLLYSSMFDAFNIDLVLTGHSHHYSVTDVVYDGQSVQELTDGGTVENAQGTVYMVSASVGRPREADQIPYSDLIAIGMDDYTERLYNVIDFSADAITVTTYEMNESDAVHSFTLTKTDDYEAPQLHTFRKMLSRFVNIIGTIYAVFNNIGEYSDLKEDGYNVSLGDFIF